jgi:hypothetical protein
MGDGLLRAGGAVHVSVVCAAEAGALISPPLQAADATVTASPFWRELAFLPVDVEMVSGLRRGFQGTCLR